MYPLTPFIDPTIQQTLDNTNKITEWITAFGSPLNVMYPENVLKNISQFNRVTNSHKLTSNIFYAYKANKSVAVLKQLSTTDINVDVASEKELQTALGAGFIGSRIEATGPKNESFVRLALMHDVILNVNTMDELRLILTLKKGMPSRRVVSLFIRIKEFNSSHVDIIQKDAKFGFNTGQIRDIIKLLVDNRELVEFLGFSFHLTTTSEQERVVAIEQTLKLTVEAIQSGLDPKGINIGGGFSINYLSNEREWYEYVSAIKTSLLDSAVPIMSWNQSGLGFWTENGKIKGSAKFSDFYRNYDQFQELDNVLMTKIPFFGTISQFLQESMLTLYIEPGRSLLDQAGITLARVSSANQSLTGETVLFLDMNRSHINSIELEFMSDPILISQKKRRASTKPNNGVFLSGNLCLPHDFICRRKVFFSNLPQVGDILAFINTAGYYMDFTESETIQHPKAIKIAIGSNGWSLDEKYQPE